MNRAAAGFLVALAVWLVLGFATGSREGVIVGVDAADPALGISKIEHIIVLMQENRSFDHYFGQLHSQGQPDAEGLPPNASNPDPTNPGGPPIVPFHQTSYCEVADLPHSWNASHRAWNSGRMDGFTAINAQPVDPTGRRTMGYYASDDLPFYYALYNTFATSDRYFASVLGPTFPNRYYLLAGTSFGHIRNSLPDLASPAFDPPNGTIFQQLDAAGVSWKVYYSQLPFAAIFGYVRAHFWGHVFPIRQFFVDAATGALPQVAYVDPILLGSRVTENDEHPPANVQVGQRFVADIVSALFRSPNWSSSAFFLTYDEHGGFFDHIPPPPAPLPDNIAPMLGPGDTPAAFDRYGFRVPVAVVSPYSRPHYVSHVVNDHTSILKFIQTRFGLPPLSNRNAQANAMLEFFDFSRATFQQPPKLPLATLDPFRYLMCL